MKGYYGDNLADREQDKLSNARRLNCADCNSPDEGQKQWNKGKWRSVVGIGVIQRSV
jgi:hypothetical protein